MENKAVGVSDFVKKYLALETESAKAKYVKEIIKTNYVGIVTKRVMLQNAIDKAVVKNGNIIYVDSLISKINFATSLILLYTNLEFDKDSDGKTNTFHGYDLLMSNGIFDVIISNIKESEIDELSGVHSSLLDNFYNEHSSTQATLLRYANSCISSLTSVINNFFGNIENILSDEKTVSAINAVLKNKK